ncbi:MAG: hypothetical protein JWO20_3075 [Candidatus Angelobacter sp.]|jgi:uncharacterized protein YggE|nr:hypothetical protein [Candidatus Angelobacter sp.]
MKRVLLVLCVSMLVTIQAGGQLSEQKSLVTVTGTGEIEVVPDEVSLYISVQNFNSDASVSRTENERRTKAVISAIQKLGVDTKDYQTKFSSIDPRYKGDDDARQLLGYVSDNSVSVKLRDVSKLMELKTKVISAGATSIGQIKFSTSRLTELRAEARVLALKAAKQKAAFMAEQLGQKIGKAFTISEVANTPGYGMMANAIQYSDSGEGADQGNVTATGVLSVVEKISVSFELI